MHRNGQLRDRGPIKVEEVPSIPACPRRQKTEDPRAEQKLMSSTGGNNCGICLDTLSRADIDIVVAGNGDHEALVFELPCGHSFHFLCAREWLQKSATCPLCRCNMRTYVINDDDFE
jgi:hypothetical protein